MMKGYTEVNYCIYIKKGNGKYYKFAKYSIVNNSKEFEPCHEPIKTKEVYDVFYLLFPILKTISEDLIEIQRAWSTFHPLNNDQPIPKNEYNKREDEWHEGCYKNEFKIN